MNIDINAIVTQFVSTVIQPIIKAEVDAALAKHTETMQKGVSDALESAPWFKSLIEDAVSNHDFDSAIEYAVRHYDFDSAIEHAVRHYDFSGDIEYAVNNYDFSGDIEHAVSNYDFSSQIDDAVDSALEERGETQDVNAKLADVLRKMADALTKGEEVPLKAAA